MVMFSPQTSPDFSVWFSTNKNVDDLGPPRKSNLALQIFGWQVLQKHLIVSSVFWKIGCGTQIKLVSHFFCILLQIESIHMMSIGHIVQDCFSYKSNQIPYTITLHGTRKQYISQVAFECRLEIETNETPSNKAPPRIRLEIRNGVKLRAQHSLNAQNFYKDLSTYLDSHIYYIYSLTNAQSQRRRMLRGCFSRPLVLARLKSRFRSTSVVFTIKLCTEKRAKGMQQKNSLGPILGWMLSSYDIVFF